MYLGKDILIAVVSFIICNLFVELFFFFFSLCG